MTIRLIILTVLNVLMISFICAMFYYSEPEYIDNLETKIPEKWDYVTVTTDAYSGSRNGKGVIVQSDSTTCTVNLGFELGFKNTGLQTFDKGSVRVVGKGTFYHKVNSYIGFNIMLITTLIIVVFFGKVFIAEVSIIWQLLNSIE